LDLDLGADDLAAQVALALLRREQLLACGWWVGAPIVFVELD
jgi:hypothetical protein